MAFIDECVSETVRFVQPTVVKYLDDLLQSQVALKTRRPMVRLASIQRRAKELHAFHMETFQLLMNTIVI